MYCSKCGRENSNAAKFCSKCGEELLPTRNDDFEIDAILYKWSKEDNNIVQNDKNKKSKIIITIIVVVLILSIVLLLAVVDFDTEKDAENLDSAKSLSANKSTYYDDSSDKTKITTAPKTTTRTTTTKSETELKIEAQNEKVEFIADCIEVSYDDLARNPEKYEGEKIKITVEVAQVISNGYYSKAYRCYEDYDIYSDDSYLNKEWYIEYFLDEGEPRILEDDIVTFYGIYDGTNGIERALTGTTDYIPSLQAEYCTINTNTTPSTTSPKTTPKTTTKKATTKITTATKPEESLTSISSVNNWNAYGTGDYVAQGLIVNNYAVLTISHDGSDYFSVKAHNNDTGDYELLVSNIGSYNGTVLIPESGNYDIEIIADGNWTATAYAIGTTNGNHFNGHGDAVTSVFLADNHNWKITNRGEGYFYVRVYDSNTGDSDYLVSEIGNYNGIVRSDNTGSMFFEITSDGDWSISPAS